MKVELPDLAAMTRFGETIAAEVRPGDVVALSGTLGAGKTTLARAILAGLGYAGEVPSPSFAIFELYDPPALRLAVTHADFYRLEDPRETDGIGLDDYREGRVLIAEWPENAGGFAGEPACLAIHLELLPESSTSARIAIVEGARDWLGRMPCP